MPFTYVLWFFVAHGFCVLVTAPGIRGMRGGDRGAAAVEARASCLRLLSIITYGSAMLAYRFGATAQLAALRETTVLFGTALAMSFLGEHMTLRRWIAAGVIAAGAIMLQLADEDLLFARPSRTRAARGIRGRPDERPPSKCRRASRAVRGAI